MKKVLACLSLAICMVGTAPFQAAAAPVPTAETLTALTKEVYKLQIALLQYRLNELNQLAAVANFNLAAASAVRPIVTNELTVIIDGVVAQKTVIESPADARSVCAAAVAAATGSLRECVYNNDVIYTTVFAN